MTIASHHALRITRTLALVGALSGLVLSGCAASVMPNDGSTQDQVSPPDSQTLTCVCCPSGDLSGRCPDLSQGSGDRAPIADAGVGFVPPDSGGIAPPPQDSGSGEAPADGSMDTTDAAAPPPPPQDSGVPMDSGIRYLDPPTGQRWCTVDDLFPARPNGPQCAVAGPMAPPEVDF